jgi:drug/metabolite transporter (DMT)-like permease
MRAANAGDFTRLLLLGSIWGSSFTAIRAAVEFISPLDLAAFRIAAAAVLLVLLVQWRGYAWPRDLGTWSMLACVGVLNSALPFFLINWGEQHVESGSAAILMAISPLTALLLSHFTTSDDRITPWKLAGLTLGFGGIAVLFGDAAFSGMGDETLAQTALLTAAICYAIAGVLARRTRHVHPYAATTVAMICSAVVITPTALLLGPVPSFDYDTVQWSLILYLAIVPTAVAALLLFRIIADAGASFVSQVNFIVPVVGVLLGAALLGEQIGIREIVALGLVLAGIGISRITKRRGAA